MTISRIETPPTSESHLVSGFVQNCAVSHVPDPARGEHPPDERPADVPDAADDHEGDEQDRREWVEVEEPDRRLPEAQQDAAKGGKGRAEREGEELCVEDPDTERSRRALVGTDGQQRAARTATPYVADSERAQREGEHDEEGITVGVPLAVDRRCRTATGMPTTVPSNPPISVELLNTMKKIAEPSPSVTTARLTPRVRRAGRAKTTPIGTAASRPPRKASSNGKCQAWTSRAVTSAARPAMPICSNESWPV